MVWIRYWLKPHPLTHWGRDKMAAVSQTTLSNAFFLNENVRRLIKISLKFVPKGPINNNPALVEIMAWRRPGDKPLSEPMMVCLLTHICVTRPQWVKAICRQTTLLIRVISATLTFFRVPRATTQLYFAVDNVRLRQWHLLITHIVYSKKISRNIEAVLDPGLHWVWFCHQPVRSFVRKPLLPNVDCSFTMQSFHKKKFRPMYIYITLVRSCRVNMKAIQNF